MARAPLGGELGRRIRLHGARATRAARSGGEASRGDDQVAVDCKRGDQRPKPRVVSRHSPLAHALGGRHSVVEGVDVRSCERRVHRPGTRVSGARVFSSIHCSPHHMLGGAATLG